MSTVASAHRYDLPAYLPPDLAVGGFRDVPLVGPRKLFGRGEVEPEIVEQPRCLRRSLFGLRRPVPCRVSESRQLHIGVLPLIACEPVKQIPVYGEEALQDRLECASLRLR